jgi:HSP20 family molecular chaperone IbpA
MQNKETKMSFLIDDFFPSGLRTPSQRGFLTNHGIHHEQVLSSATIEFNENDTGIRLSMDLPGVHAKDLEVSVQRGVLSIRGYRSQKSIDGQVVKKQKISRRFAVDTDTVDVTHATANLSNGVLLITAPKKSKPVTVKIPVTEYQDDGTDDTTAGSGFTASRSNKRQSHTASKL